MKFPFSSLWQRRWFRICTYVFSGFVSILLLIFTLLQLPPIQRQMSQTLSAMLSDEKTKINISPISGFLPFDVHIDHVSIADDKGEWLRLENAALSWSFTALLTGELLVHELGGRRLTLNRLPPSTEKVEEDEPFDIPDSLPDLDIDLMRVNIHHLGIDEIRLGKAVAGEAMNLTLTADAQTVGKQIQANVKLQRTDSDDLNLAFNALLHLKPLKLTTTLKAHETGGLLAALSGQPQMKDFHLQFKGDGLLEDWRADWNASLDGVGKLDSVLKLGIKDKKPWLDFTLLAKLQAGLLPEELLESIGSRQELSVQLLAQDSENLAVKKFHFNNALLRLESSMDVNLADQTIKAGSQLEIETLSRLNALAGMKLSGKSRLNAAVKGTLEKPQLTLELSADEIKADDFAIKHLQTGVDIVTEDTLETGAFTVAVKGFAEDLRQQGKKLPESNLKWRVQLFSDEQQKITLKNLNVDGDWAHLKLAGVFDAQKQQGDLNLNIVADSLKAVAGNIDANINTDAQIKIHPEIKKIDIALDGGIYQLAGLGEPVSSLLGPKISLNAIIGLEPAKMLTVKKLQLKANALTLDGETTLNLKNQNIASAFHMLIPKFKHKDLSVQQAKAQLNLAGTTEKPDLKAQINLASVKAAGQRLDAIRLQLNAQDAINNLHGNLRLDLKQHGQPLALRSDYALRKNILKLDDLNLNAPKTTLTAGLAVNLDNTQVTGKLNADSDLQALKLWTGTALSGRLNLKADLKPNASGQQVLLNAGLDGLGVAELNIKKITLDAKVENALKKPSLVADLKLQQLSQQQTQVDSLTLNAKGVLEKLQLNLATQGKHQKPFSVNLQALLQHTNKQTGLQLQKIGGNVAGQKLALKDSSLITLAGKNISLSPLSLSLGSANLNARLDYSPKAINGNVSLALPLDFANQFVEIPVNGDVNTSIKLSGTALQPELDLSANLEKLKLKELDFKKFPATGIRLNATLKQQLLQAQVNISNSQFKRAIQLDAKTPLKLQLEPFAWELPQDQLQGRLLAALDLAQTTENLPLTGQKIGGDFDMDISFSGSVEKPQLQGGLKLVNGEYQNAATETLFKDIFLNVATGSEKIELTKLALNDGAEGRLDAKAFVSLAQSEEHPFDGEINFNHLRLANSPELKTHLSGGLKLSGNLKQALLSGLLNIDDFHLTLPSSSGQKAIPEMEVIEIGGNRASLKQQLKERKAKEKKEMKLALDIGVKIDKQFYIKGYGLDSEWRGKLKIKGPANMPRVLGKVETKRGSLELLNNRFVFKRGLIDFNGAFPPMPSLDIETAAKTDSGEAFIRIGGMANDPKLSLSHSPALPQDEIISTLLFGQDAKSISPMQALQLTDVIGILATGGLASLDTLGNLQSGLGLDRLSIGGDDFDTASVKAGKYITDRIYLEVEQGLQSESSTATVEIDLLPDVKAEVEFNQDADSSVGIKWKHDY